MNEYDINFGKTTKEFLEYLNDLAEQDGCNGECDAESPYIKCDICEAKWFLNNLADDVRSCCKQVQTLTKYRTTLY